MPSCREADRGQTTTSPRSSCWQLVPPTVTFTSTQSATAPSPMYCRDVRTGRALSPSSRPQPEPFSIPAPHPLLTSNLMAFSSGFRGARSVLGGWGGGRKRKPGSVKPAAPSPQALRFPGTHPWEPRTTYSGRRHRSCSGSCSVHCGAHKRAVSQAAHTGPPQAPWPSLGGLQLRALGQPSFLLAGPTCPLTLLSTARSPSWKDRLRYHTDVRCRPRMVTWEPLWRKAGVGSGCSEAGALAPRRPG